MGTVRPFLHLIKLAEGLLGSEVYKIEGTEQFKSSRHKYRKVQNFKDKLRG